MSPTKLLNTSICNSQEFLVVVVIGVVLYFEGGGGGGGGGCQRTEKYAAVNLLLLRVRLLLVLDLETLGEIIQ